MNLEYGRAVQCSCGAVNEGQSTFHTLANYAKHDDYCSRITRTFTAEQMGYDGQLMTSKLDNGGNVIAR